MKLGIPTLIEFSDIGEHAELCKYGFDFIELNFTFPWLQGERLDVQALNKIKRDYGIYYTVHLHDQLDPFNFCEDLRSASVKNIVGSIEAAARLDADRLTLHLHTGAYSSRASGRVYLCNIYRESYLDNVRRFLDIVSPLLEKYGITLCIENTTGFVDVQKQAIELLLQRPCFGITFDIGHSCKSKSDDESFILSHRDRIRHFHIHDVTPLANHIALGSGMIDLPKYFELVRQTSDQAVIEVKESSALVESMQYILRNGLR